MKRALALAAAAGLIAFGCQSKTEHVSGTGPSDLPANLTNPTPTQPVTVTPVPVPVPVPGPVTEIPSGGGPNNPATQPTPEPTTGGGGGGGNGGGGGGSNSAVVRVGAKVYFVECNGQQVPDTEHATTAPVGCRLHLDVTPKDANNQPTQARGRPEWTFSPGSLVQGGRTDDYTPVLGIAAPGDFTAYCVIDGVRSNNVNVRFVR